MSICTQLVGRWFDHWGSDVVHDGRLCYGDAAAGGILCVCVTRGQCCL
jgi:hypothetical protein